MRSVTPRVLCAGVIMRWAIVLSCLADTACMFPIGRAGGAAAADDGAEVATARVGVPFQTLGTLIAAS